VKVVVTGIEELRESRLAGFLFCLHYLQDGELPAIPPAEDQSRERIMEIRRRLLSTAHMKVFWLYEGSLRYRFEFGPDPASVENTAPFIPIANQRPFLQHSHEMYGHFAYESLRQ
jgi:hypothetical protein